MGPFEMVVGIVLIVTIGSIVRAKHARGHRDLDMTGDGGEARQLRGEIAQLKERIAVLERLATDDNDAKRLDREIEKLREGR